MNEKLTEKIERYLSGVMSPEEEKAFDLELSANQTLKEEVALHRLTVDLMENEARANVREKVRSINQKASGGQSLKPLLRIAAILAVLLVPVYLIISAQFTNEQLYQAYSTPYPDRITMMGDDDKDEVSKAMELYNAEEYTEAATAFYAIRTSKTIDEQLIIYEAVSLTRSGQSAAAVDLLETTLDQATSNLAALEWELILAYLKNDQDQQALGLLEVFLKNNNGYQQQKAEELLDDLQSIWR